MVEHPVQQICIVSSGRLDNPLRIINKKENKIGIF